MTPDPVKSDSRTATIPLRRIASLFTIASTSLVLSCGGDAVDSNPTGPSVGPFAVATVSGAGQTLFAGQRSEAPFIIRVTTEAGAPVVERTVRFTLVGEASGVLSQPEALTDANGVAETYLLESTPGEGRLVAGVDGTEAEFAFTVLRAPGMVEILPGSGAVGLPGQPHPDSIIEARVLDTEGMPLAGVEVFFIAPGRLETVRDTTDADGVARTLLRETRLTAADQSVIAFILGFPSIFGVGQRALRSVADRAVLISVDGLRGDAIAAHAPPTLSAMAAGGAFTSTARTIVPSLTVPAHLSMLSGVGPESHGLFTDELRFTSEMAGLDPLFKNARSSGRTAVAFMAEDGPLENFREILRCRLAFGLDSLTIVPPSADEVVDEALSDLSDPSTELVFLHFPDADIAGHTYGWSSPEYRDAVLEIDAAIARVLDALDEKTLVVVTSDHGGGGDFGDRLHGSASPEDVNIPMLFHGPAVSNVDLGTPSILDLAPTLLWAIGLAPPSQYEGEILLNGFGL